VRVMSVQRLTRQGLARLAPTILALAAAEGLQAHADSIEVRLRAPRTERRARRTRRARREP
jgi:histidinol dehydrogenase